MKVTPTRKLSCLTTKRHATYCTVAWVGREVRRRGGRGITVLSRRRRRSIRALSRGVRRWGGREGRGGVTLSLSRGYGPPEETDHPRVFLTLFGDQPSDPRDCKNPTQICVGRSLAYHTKIKENFFDGNTKTEDQRKTLLFSVATWWKLSANLSVYIVNTQLKTRDIYCWP